MSRKKRKGSVTRVVLDVEPSVSSERDLSPVVWVGWQIRRGEKYFGVVQRADGTVERTRLERDDLQAAADFVTAHKMGQAASIRGRQVRTLT
jgi:hypothetical protein